MTLRPMASAASGRRPSRRERARAPSRSRPRLCRPPPRDWSHRCFENRGTKYVRESGVKWICGSTKRQRDRTLPPPRHVAGPRTWTGAAQPYSRCSVSFVQRIANENVPGRATMASPPRPARTSGHAGRAGWASVPPRRTRPPSPRSHRLRRQARIVLTHFTRAGQVRQTPTWPKSWANFSII